MFRCFLFNIKPELGSTVSDCRHLHNCAVRILFFSMCGWTKNYWQAEWPTKYKLVKYNSLIKMTVVCFVFTQKSDEWCGQRFFPRPVHHAVWASRYAPFVPSIGSCAFICRCREQSQNSSVTRVGDAPRNRCVQNSVRFQKNWKSWCIISKFWGSKFLSILFFLQLSAPGFQNNQIQMEQNLNFLAW